MTGENARCDTERVVLAACVLDSRNVELATSTLSSRDFTDARHREVYRAMQALRLRRLPVELVTLAHELARRGTLDALGGAGYVASLVDELPNPFSAADAIRLVRQRALSDEPDPTH